MVKVIENGYTVDLDNDIITTKAGYKIDGDVLKNVGSLYDKLKVTNIIIDNFNKEFTHPEAWNLACEISKDEKYLETYVVAQAQAYLSNREAASGDKEIEME